MSVKKLRDLPVSAASGLVITDNIFYTVADDALHLGMYKLDDETFEKNIRLREGELPADEKARKKLKPDFEALVMLPAAPQHPHGALLAIGSGSKKNRQQAVLVPLDKDGHATDAISTLDLAPLYKKLDLEDCNIEGAVLCGETIVLMQRGNNRHEKSALIHCLLEDFLRGETAASIVDVLMPCVQNVPLGFTDGLLLPNGNILFSAVAEDSDDSYSDGPCLGAAIGEISLQGDIIRYERLPDLHKIEGIALGGDGRYLYAVTDADDPDVPAALLEIDGCIIGR